MKISDCVEYTVCILDNEFDKRRYITAKYPKEYPKDLIRQEFTEEVLWVLTTTEVLEKQQQFKERT